MADRVVARARWSRRRGAPGRRLRGRGRWRRGSRRRDRSRGRGRGDRVPARAGPAELWVLPSAAAVPAPPSVLADGKSSASRSPPLAECVAGGGALEPVTLSAVSFAAAGLGGGAEPSGGHSCLAGASSSCSLTPGRSAGALCVSAGAAPLPSTCTLAGGGGGDGGAGTATPCPSARTDPGAAVLVTKASAVTAAHVRGETRDVDGSWPRTRSARHTGHRRGTRGSRGG